MMNPSVADSNKAAIERLYNEYYNQGNLDLLPRLVSPDFINHTTKQVGRDGFLEVTRALQRAFEGLHFEIEEIFAEGDLVITLWRMTGRHVAPFRGYEPSGRQVMSQGLAVTRMTDSRLAELWLQLSGLKVVAELVGASA